MAYLDGFVLPIPTDKKEEYVALARKFGAKAMQLGALAGHEAIGDGLEQGTLTSFPRAVHLAEGENVVFSYVLWPDKATRDQAWEKIMGDPEMNPGPDMPFDGKRMFWGGFEPLVDYSEL